MIMAPDKVLSGMGIVVGDVSNYIFQIVGMNLFVIGWINFLARNDEGSPALKAILVGNILLHIFGFALDFYGFGKGVSGVSSVISGAVVHIGLVCGFFYFLMNFSKKTETV